ncbi:MAG: NAD-binding protein, partial [Gillisia sp.]
FLGVDFDPTVINEFQKENSNIVYGDIEDPELLERIPFQNAKNVISTVSDMDHSMHLIKTLERTGYKGKIYLTAIHEKDYKTLNKMGPYRVLLPHQMAAENFYNSFLSENEGTGMKV